MMNQQQSSTSGNTPMEGVVDRKNHITKANSRNIAQKRMKRGECPTCGTKTHKVQFFGSKKMALTVEGQAFYGRCLICNPFEGYPLSVVPQTLEIAKRQIDDDAASLVSEITIDYALFLGAMHRENGVLPEENLDEDTNNMKELLNAPKKVPPEPSIGEDENNDDWRCGNSDFGPPRCPPNHDHDPRDHQRDRPPGDYGMRRGGHQGAGPRRPRPGKSRKKPSRSKNSESGSPKLSNAMAGDTDEGKDTLMTERSFGNRVSLSSGENYQQRNRSSNRGRGGDGCSDHRNRHQSLSEAHSSSSGTVDGEIATEAGRKKKKENEIQPPNDYEQPRKMEENRRRSESISIKNNQKGNDEPQRDAHHGAPDSSAAEIIKNRDMDINYVQRVVEVEEMEESLRLTEHRGNQIAHHSLPLESKEGGNSEPAPRGSRIASLDAKRVKHQDLLETVDPTTMAAIKYDQLIEVQELASATFGRWSRWLRRPVSMRDVHAHIIMPICQQSGKSYAMYKNPQGCPVEAFVTHSWDEPFNDFVKSIKEVFKSFARKPNLWICAFALNQCDSATIETQITDVPLEDSPFVKALRAASSFVVVRNSVTDLYSRIWCVCEIMYAKNYGFIPDKTYITGPNSFSHAKSSCVDAESSNIEDKVKILRELLLNDHNFKEIDGFIDQFRRHRTLRYRGRFFTCFT